MNPTYHSTRDYHLKDLQTLGWELTVCNSLHPENSPCRGILRRSASYGKLLYDFLDRIRPMKEVGRILEVGGGYGWLMRDFLSLQPELRAVMLDLSPVLIEKQREALEGFGADFIHSDFLDIDPSFLEGFDMAIFNENLGDFPVVLGIGRSLLDRPEQDTISGHPGNEPAESLRRVLDFYRRYGLDRPVVDPFNCSLGAMQTVEKLCRAGLRRIFLSEHSCEATVPEPLAPLARISSTCNPERIRLRGHDEYTVSFSHLQEIARHFGYRSVRGPLADFIEIDFSDRVQTILRSRLDMADEHEILRHFVEDLFKYEYLLLIAS